MNATAKHDPFEQCKTHTRMPRTIKPIRRESRRHILCERTDRSKGFCVSEQRTEYPGRLWLLADPVARRKLVRQTRAEETFPHSEHCIELGIRRQCLRLPSELLGCPEVVSINECKQLSAAGGNAGI